MATRRLVLAALVASQGSWAQQPLVGSELGRWADLPSMDTHVHLSDWSVVSYTYDKSSANYHNYTQAEYKLDSQFSKALPSTKHKDTCHFVTGLVGVPHEEQLLQSTWAQGVAEQVFEDTPRICGIVTTISYDLDLAGDQGKFKAFLDKVEAEVPLNVGYRCSFSNLAAPEGLQGLRELAARKATFDVFTGTLTEAGEWTTSIDKLQQVAEVAAEIPDLVMIVDHLGFPGVAGAIPPDFGEWKRFTAPLVQHPNVYLKVSSGALGMDVMRPYVRYCVEAFGYDRLLWSSNWYNINHQEGFYSYNAWAATVVQYMIELNATDDDAASIFYNTALRAYRPNLEWEPQDPQEEGGSSAGPMVQLGGMVVLIAAFATSWGCSLLAG